MNHRRELWVRVPWNFYINGCEECQGVADIERTDVASPCKSHRCSFRPKESIWVRKHVARRTPALKHLNEGFKLTSAACIVHPLAEPETWESIIRISRAEKKWCFSQTTTHQYITSILFWTWLPPSTLMESTMNTRSRTRSGVSKVPNTSPTPKLQTKSKNRTVKDPQHDVDISSGYEGKEKKDKAVKISNVNSKKPKKSLRSVLCFCSKDDDGSPMILCSECKIWYVYY